MHPPLQAISQGNVLTAIRWLLLVALPFPGCLCEFRDIAVSLRLDPDWAASNARFRHKIKSAFRRAAYRGSLATFQGARWWKSGVDAIVWERTAGKFFDRDVLKKLAGEMIGLSAGRLKTIDAESPVLTVDADFRRTDTVMDIADAVQIQPDDWPPSVENPWIAISTIQANPRLKAMVDPKDAGRVE